MEAAGRTGFDARGLEPLRNAIHAQRALENFAGRGAELGNVKRAAAHAVPAADALVLLEIHDAVDVLDDGAIGGTRDQTARLFAMHALVLAHQELQAAIFAFMLVELDQVPVVPLRFRHGLVGIVEGGLAKRESVPLETRHFASLATDARGGIDQLADVELPLDTIAGDRAGMSRDPSNFQNRLAHVGGL